MKRQTSIFKKQCCYLASDEQVKTQIVTAQNVDDSTRSYISFYSKEEESIQSENFYFQDESFPINLETIQALDQSQPIILKRLSQIFHKNFCPPLFPEKLDKKPGPISSNSKLFPHFVYQMKHFDIFTFKRLFITQNITENGRYHVLINRDGIFYSEIVDDIVPVYKKDNSSIWGLQIEEPWQLIIAKVWAKQAGGYQNIATTKPFEFIEHFTPSVWRYVNLDKEGRQFLFNYYQKLNKTCRILLKTKNEEEISRSGLIVGQLAYELIEFDKYQEKGKPQFNLLVKSVFYHSWTGNLSVFDNRFKGVFRKLKSNFELQTTFLIPQPDFFNIFSSAYIISNQRQVPQFVNFHSFTVPQKNQIPLFLTFTIEKKGLFIFNILQNQYNKQQLSLVSRLMTQSFISRSSLRNINEASSFQRFLKVKYILSRRSDWHNQQEQTSQNSASSNRNYFINQKQLQQLLKYQLIDFDFSKGHNRGDAHPLILRPGTYVMRIQTQKIQNISNFTIQYYAHQNIQFTQCQIGQFQEVNFFRHSFMSIRHQVPKQPLNNELNGSIFFGNQFNILGFGFLAVVFYKRFSDKLLIKIDPQLLKRQGYTICLQHKNNREQFSISLKGGEFQIFVLERIEDGRKGNKYVWPSNAFKFYLT